MSGASSAGFRVVGSVFPGWRSVSFLPTHCPLRDVLPAWLARPGPWGPHEGWPWLLTPCLTAIALMSPQSLLFQTAAVKIHTLHEKESFNPLLIMVLLLGSCHSCCTVWLLGPLSGTAVVSSCPCSKGSQRFHNTGRWAGDKPRNILAVLPASVLGVCLGELWETWRSQESSCHYRRGSCAREIIMKPSLCPEDWLTAILRDCGTCFDVSLSWHDWFLLSPSITLAFKHRCCVLRVVLLLWIETKNKKKRG